MIKINKKIVLGVLVSSLCLSSCNEVLDEQPRSGYTVDYFNSSDGVTSGITALYRSLRLLYGNGYYMSATQNGTDEATCSKCGW